MNELKSVLEKLNSPSDWALVLGFSTLAFVLDAAIDAIPLTLFTPAICAAVAASTTLAVKRAWEAVHERAEFNRQLEMVREEAVRCAELMRSVSSEEDYRAIRFDIEQYRDSLSQLRYILKQLRQKLELREPYSVERETYPTRFRGPPLFL